MNGRAVRGPPAIRWLAVLTWMAVIFLLSAQPGLRVSQDPAVDGPARAMGHVTVFAVLGALLLNALAQPGSSARRAIALALLLAALYAVSDEAHQAFVPERSARLHDVLLDVAGASIGVSVMAALLRLRSRSGR
ncbi:VanZ family protein [soil metagenome]